MTGTLADDHTPGVLPLPGREPGGGARAAAGAPTARLAVLLEQYTPRDVELAEQMVDELFAVRHRDPPRSDQTMWPSH